MNFPDDETGQVLTEMQQAGIDLSIEHEVVFFNLFEKEQQAKEMLAFIEESMPKVKVTIAPDESPNVWDVDCTMRLLPSYDNIIEHETAFEKIAEKYNGYNDGWGIEA